MTERPLPPSDPAPAGLPRDALGDLAADDLPPGEAEALRARIEAEPALRRAYEEARALERLLAAQQPWPLPRGLSERVLAGVLPAPRRTGPLVTLLRVAAAVLVFFSSWLLAGGGGTPALADVGAPALLVGDVQAGAAAGLVGPVSAWQAPAPLARAAEVPAAWARTAPAVSPVLLLVLGLGALGVGLALARSWNRGAARPPGGDR